MKTIGIVTVADLTASAPSVLPIAAITPHVAADQIIRHGGQSIVVALRPTIFDRHVAALNITGFAKTLAIRAHRVGSSDADWLTLYRQAGRCGEPPATSVAGWYDRRRYSADEGGPCPA